MNTIEELIINNLQQGLNQTEIANLLKQNDIRLNSQSSIEIKEKYEAKISFHLTCILYNGKVLESMESHNGE